MQVKPRKYGLIFLILFLSLNHSTYLQAQTLKVLDENNKPVIGASAYTNDLNYSILSDSSGVLDFATFPDSSSVIVSFYGFQPIDLMLDATLPKKIHLEPISFLFNEFVLVGDDKRPLTQQIQQIDILKPKSIGSYQAQTPAELLENSGKVFVQKSQMGGGSPILRGFEASRILLVVDGIKMNNAIYRSGHLQNSITLNNQALEQVEIIQGPASLLYGSDALGGVIHYKTCDPKLKLKDSTKTYSGSLSTSYNSVNGGTIISSLNEISGKRFASLSIISLSNFNNLKTGRKGIEDVPDTWRRFTYQDFINGQDTIIANVDLIQPEKDQSHVLIGTAYQQVDLLQKLRYKPTEDLEIGLNIQYSQSSDIPRYDQLSETVNGQFRFGEWNYGPQIRGLAALKINYKASSGLFDESQLTMGYQDIEESRIRRKFNEGNRVHNIEKLNVWSANWVFQKQLKSNLKQSLFYGIDAQLNKLESGGFTEQLFGEDPEIFYSRYPSGKANAYNMGAFANYLIKDKSGNKQLNAGLRASVHHTDLIFENTIDFSWPQHYTDGSLNINNHALVASFAYKQKLKPKTEINLSLSNAFRAPNIDDLGKIRIKGNFVNMPNPNISPEKAITADFGIASSFKKLEISTNAFCTLAKDLLVRQIAEETLIPEYISLVNTNVTNGFITGLTAQLDLKINEQLSLSYTGGYTKGRYNYKDADLNIDTLVAIGHIPPLYGSGSVRWSNKQFECALIHRFNGKKRLEDYEVLTISRDTEGNNTINREGSSDNIEYGFVESNGNETIYKDLPSWQTFNLYVSWKTLHQRVFLSVENIFDKHYRTFSSGLSAPGRNIALGLIFNY